MAIKLMDVAYSSKQGPQLSVACISVPRFTLTLGGVAQVLLKCSVWLAQGAPPSGRKGSS